ncbi:MAG: response regulator transcription factor [Anaerovoracaceae bacterium]|jgi:two-component system OmpR family response regulator
MPDEIKDAEDAKILIVEDDKDISTVVELLLKHSGYQVVSVYDGPSALMKMDDSIDLVLLDVMLPGMSGIDVCREIRREFNTPILFLTAKSSDEDKAEGLMAGGDDYLIKPFSEIELLARVKAIMRRYQVYRGKPEVNGETYLVARGLKLSEQFNAVWKNGIQIDLTDIEYRMLKLLMQNKNRIFPIKTIYESIWDEPYFYSSNNTVMVHIRKLRKKIEDDPQNPTYIRTEWGRGYKFVG